MRSVSSTQSSPLQAKYINLNRSKQLLIKTNAYVYERFISIDTNHLLVFLIQSIEISS